jgi:hypothetical protein
LSYDQLYRDALLDPELKRTSEELTEAMSNASEARKVVFELFQDLDRFSLDDYQPFANVKQSQTRLLTFLEQALKVDGGVFRRLDQDRFSIEYLNGHLDITCTINRDIARSEDGLDLIGIDHPLVTRFIDKWKMVTPDSIAISVSGYQDMPCILTLWMVHSHLTDADQRAYLTPLAVDRDGRRVPTLEKRRDELFRQMPKAPVLDLAERQKLLADVINPMLQRELQHRGIATEQGGYAVEMVGWVETS